MQPLAIAAHRLSECAASSLVHFLPRRALRQAISTQNPNDRHIRYSHVAPLGRARCARARTACSPPARGAPWNGAFGHTCRKHDSHKQRAGSRVPMVRCCGSMLRLRGAALATPRAALAAARRALWGRRSCAWPQACSHAFWQRLGFGTRARRRASARRNATARWLARASLSQPRAQQRNTTDAHGRAWPRPSGGMGGGALARVTPYISCCARTPAPSRVQARGGASLGMSPAPVVQVRTAVRHTESKAEWRPHRRHRAVLSVLTRSRRHALAVCAKWRGLIRRRQFWDQNSVFFRS